MLLSVDFPFLWNIPSGFGIVHSQSRGNNVSRGFNFPWVSTPFLGGNFVQWVGYPFIYMYSPRGFFPETSFGNTFPLGSMPTPSGSLLGGISSPRSSHAPGSASILGGNYPSRTSNPSRSTNMGGPQSSFRSQGASSSSQYSFSHTLFPLLETLYFPYFSCLKNDPISNDPS